MKLGDYIVNRTPHIIAASLQAVDLTLATAEHNHITRVIELACGNINVAARMLGVTRRCLERRGYRSSR